MTHGPMVIRRAIRRCSRPSRHGRDHRAVRGRRGRWIPGILAEYFSEEPSAAHWVVLVAGPAGVTGAAHYVAEPFTSGIWNILFIGVRPAEQGKGRGRALMTSVEEDLRTRAARIALVETSGLDRFERTRAFYRLQGFDEEARIRDYYAPGANKITFSKKLGDFAARHIGLSRPTPGPRPVGLPGALDAAQRVASDTRVNRQRAG